MQTPIVLDKKLPMMAADILSILPHRYPFLLIDRVLDVSGGFLENRAGRKVEAIKCITLNEPFFPGHFPKEPIVPGVLLLECLAQAAALCCYIPLTGAEENYEFYIVSADKVRFRKPVVPGDVLKMSVECIKDRKSMLVFDCKATVEGTLVAEGQIMANVRVSKN